MDKINYNLVFLFVSNIVALFIAIWKLSQWEQKLQQQINENRKDLNGGLESLRSEMRRRDYLINVQLNTLIKFVEKTQDYNPPSTDSSDFN